jgi:hypothetical protein
MRQANAVDTVSSAMGYKAPGGREIDLTAVDPNLVAEDPPPARTAEWRPCCVTFPSLGASSAIHARAGNANGDPTGATVAILRDGDGTSCGRCFVARLV